MIQERVDSLLRDRAAAIEEARSEGAKVVGYFPGGYVPEEIIYASGAIPVCLAHGGDVRAAGEGLAVLPHIICPFIRAQVGELRLKSNPYYTMIDLLVVPSTCQHMRKVADVLELSQPELIFKLGVPYEPGDGFSLSFFKERLDDLRAGLAELTGVPVTDEALREAMTLYNRMRGLLKSISLLRTQARPPLSGSDFARLNHASFYVDPVDMVEALEDIYRSLQSDPAAGPADGPSAGLTPERPVDAGAQTEARPRLALVGPNLAYGDYDILDIVEECGGDVVIEDVFEGTRDYWHTVAPGSDDPIETLARSYLLEKAPRMFMRSSTQARVDEVLRLAEEFAAEGVIWYQLVCCELYDEEAFYFEKRLQEAGLPMLALEADYGGLRAGGVRTRVEAFLELIQGGLTNA